MNIQVDTSKFTASLVKLKAKAKVAERFSLLQIGNEIMRLSQMEVPHDKGTLQNSGDVVEQGEDVLVGYHCVEVSTKILKADLSWVSAGELIANDRILSVDESIVGGNGNDAVRERKIRFGFVEANYISEAECVKVVTDKGEIIVTIEHPFLARKNAKHGGWEWYKISDLAPGHTIKFTFEPWETINNGDSWLAGMADGEGAVSNKRVSIYQNDFLSPRIESELEKYGFTFGVYSRGRDGRAVTNNFYIRGLSQTMPFLGRFRPQRLIKNWQEQVVKKPIGLKGQANAKILSIESAGTRKIANLTTSPPTFISNGFVSHNTPYAHRLHEHPEYRFQKGRKGKYLTDPIQRNAEVLGLQLGKTFEKELGNGVS